MADPFGALWSSLSGSVLGVDAIYSVGGTAPLADPIRVMVGDGDPTIESFGRSLVATSAVLEISAADVETPAAEDTITVDSTVYKIIGTPRYDHTLRSWICETDGGTEA